MCEFNISFNSEDRVLVGCCARERLLDWIWTSWPHTRTLTAILSGPVKTTTVQEQPTISERLPCTCPWLDSFSLEFHWLSQRWRLPVANLLKFSL